MSNETLNIKKAKTLKNGDEEITVIVPKGSVLVVVDPDSHYKLSDPHNAIISGHRIIDNSRVYWCDIEQQWIE